MGLFKESFGGPNGFEELRKYIKQGNDFSKDVVSILQERAELEASYSKGLARLSKNLLKASKDLIGTSAYVWQEVSTKMEHEADIHRNLSNVLQEDITKQLKILVESQHKSRKQIEASVDKCWRILNDRRSEETKMKKLCYSGAKENEKIQDLCAESATPRSRSSKILSEKDQAKLDQKRKKIEENIHKCDHEYFSLCLKAERARQDYDLRVNKGQEEFQLLEEDRLVKMQDFVEKYSNHMSSIGPKLIEDSGRLCEAIATLDIQSDLAMVSDVKGTGPNIPEQFLPHYYAEDLKNSMHKDRRKEFLEKYAQLVRATLELEKKGQQGIRTLSRGLTAHFNETANHGELSVELLNMETTQNFLEAFQFRLHSLQCCLESRNPPTHPLSGYLETIRDKQGMVQVVLKVPTCTTVEENRRDVPDTPIQHRHETTHHRQSPVANNCQSIGRCRALYLYEGNEGDELTIAPGDVILLYTKADEWWHGELNGNVGFFPASYVEEI